MTEVVAKKIAECPFQTVVNSNGTYSQCQSCGVEIKNLHFFEHGYCAGERVGYMCRTDFECELGEADDGSRVYPSLETLKEASPCVRSCGWVAVRVTLIRGVGEVAHYDRDTEEDEAAEPPPEEARAKLLERLDSIRAAYVAKGGQLKTFEELERERRNDD